MPSGRSCFVLALAASVSTGIMLADSLRIAQRSVEEIARETREARLLRTAHRVIPLTAGSRLLVHLESNAWEKGAIGGTLVTPGTAKTFWAENFITGNVALPTPNTVGQIYSGALFPDGDTLALSIGWVDRNGSSHNAIAISSLLHGRRNLIEADGTVRDLVPGPGSSLVAITYLPSRGKSGAPLVTVLDTRGFVHGEFFPLPIGADARTIGEAVHTARLERIDETHFALYREQVPDVSIVEISLPSKVVGQKALPAMLLEKMTWPVKAIFPETPDATASVVKALAVPDPEGIPDSPRERLTLGVHAEKDGSATVVRASNKGRPHTTVTRYRSGFAPVSWSPATPWQTAYWTGKTLVGVASQGDVTVLENVIFEEK